MEVLTITTEYVLARKPCGNIEKVALGDISESHDLIRDPLSYRIGALVALLAKSANDEEYQTGR